MKVKTVYTLPATPIALTDWVLRDDWFPEISVTSNLGTDVLEELEKEGRLKVKCLVDFYIDYRRYAAMHTVWFDELPVFIVQNAGREGDDHFNRWVTDLPRYLQLLGYLQSKIPLEIRFEATDPEKEVFPEEIFRFYGMDFSDQVGYNS